METYKADYMNDIIINYRDIPDTEYKTETMFLQTGAYICALYNDNGERFFSARFDTCSAEMQAEAYIETAKAYNVRIVVFDLYTGDVLYKG